MWGCWGRCYGWGMASTTTRRAPAARKPAAKASARKPAASRARSTPARRAKPRSRSAWETVRERAAAQLGEHASDAGALALGVLGILAVLGVFTDLAGPVGRGLDTSTGVLLGNGRLLVPAACFVGAGFLLAGRRAEAPTHGLRVGLGVALAILGAAGLLHIAGGSPPTDTLDPLRDAGGVAGALTGGPLRSGAGPVGAVVVLAALTGFGLLLVVGAGLRQVAGGFGAAGRFVGRQGRALLTLRPAGDALGGYPTPDLYDELADDDSSFTTVVDLAGAEDAELAARDDEFDHDDVSDQDDMSGHDDDAQGVAPDHLGAVATTPDALAGDDAEGQLELNLGPGVRHSAWKLPPKTILKRSQNAEVDERSVDAGGRVLEATMQEFGVDARLIGRTIGPTVTRYELELAAGVKVSKVTGLSKEIAYAMASHDVRILAPIPGRSAIGVEVPNKQRPLVTLGDVLASDEARRAKHPLEVGMGRDIAGRAVMANLALFPHVLIAGATGAGKSSCINSIVTSILMRSTPDQVRLILVDPKRVELGQYNGLPHLLSEVVTNPKKAANALDWAVREMEMRYDLLAEVGVRDIDGYNAMHDRGDLPTEESPDPMGAKSYERLPYILIVVDELNDLMMVAARDVENSICRIAQMARAVGIHLVIATQRPSVDVITGVIKANVPSRLAFSVSSLADSRVILDQPGAEKLVGKGDMLMLAASSSRTERVQGSWVDEDCVRKAVAHWRRQVTEVSYVEGIQGADGPGGGGASVDDDGDDLLEEAMDLVVRSGLGSTSMLQRKLRVGFARAGRLMDLLERRGVVGPSEGSKARSVLMTVDELEEMRGRS